MAPRRLLTWMPVSGPSQNVDEAWIHRWSGMLTRLLVGSVKMMGT